MKTILGFPLVLTDEQLITVSTQREFLCTQVKNDVITLWARVETNAPQEGAAIRMYLGGQPIPDEDTLAYIGTVQLGVYTWHIFELLLV